MAEDRICSRCGGVDEFVYEINWKPVYYCAACDVQSTSTHELYGPDEKAVDDAGEGHGLAYHGRHLYRTAVAGLLKLPFTVCSKVIHKKRLLPESVCPDCQE